MTRHRAIFAVEDEKARCKPVSVLLDTGEQNMERVTLRIPKQQIEQVERMVDSGEYPNRSEAIRSAIREKVSEKDLSKERPSEKRQRRKTWAQV